MNPAVTETPIPAWVTPQSEAEFDKIYHAIPEWVNRKFPNTSMAERIKNGFEHQQKTWTESFLKEVEDHRKVREFLVYLTKTHGLNFSQEYWNFLRSKDPQGAIVSPVVPPMPEASA